MLSVSLLSQKTLLLLGSFLDVRISSKDIPIFAIVARIEDKVKLLFSERNCFSVASVTTFFKTSSPFSSLQAILFLEPQPDSKNRPTVLIYNKPLIINGCSH